MYIDEETSRLRLIVNWIVDIVVVISVAWFIVFSLGTQITMTGQSMDPVLSQDEVVLMNRLSVRFGKIKRFDIVVFEKEENPLMTQAKYICATRALHELYMYTVSL